VSRKILARIFDFDDAKVLLLNGVKRKADRSGQEMQKK
jgi:hypothetical protein